LKDFFPRDGAVNAFRCPSTGGDDPPGGQRARPSPAGALPSYFSGLLPEGRRLGALRRAVKTSADDELSLLLESVPRSATSRWLRRE